MPARKLVLAVMLVVAALFAASCGERPEKVLARAQAHFQKGDFAAAEAEARKATVAAPKLAAAHDLLGRSLYKLRRFEEAQTALETAVALDPRLTEAQLTLGEVYLLLGKPEAAAAKADLVLARGERVEALLLRAAVERARRNPKDALVWCRRAIAREPRRPEGYLLAAQVAGEAGQLGQAAATLEEGSRVVPEPLPLQVSLAEVYAAQGRVGEAERTIAGLISRHPDDPKLRLVLAEYYGRQGKGAQAERQLRRATELRPNDEQLRVRLVDFLVGQGRAPEAEAEAKAALARIRPGYVLRARLAGIFRATGRPEAAIATYREAIELGPEQPEALGARVDIASVYLEERRFELALKELDFVLRQNPHDPLANLVKGKVLLAKNDVAAAVKTLQVAVQDSPTPGEPHLWLAQAQALSGQDAKAEETLREALRLRPDFAQARRALARVYLTEGDFRAAKAELDRLLAGDPRDAAAWSELGALHAAREEFHQAERCFRKLVELRPQDHTGHYRLGLLAARQARFEEAATELARAFELAPDFGLAAAAYVRVRLAQNDSAKAVSWLKGRIDKRPQDAWLQNLMGEVQTALGQTSEAEEHLVAAQRLAPGWRVPYENLCVLYARSGQFEQAEARLREGYRATGSTQSGFMLGMLQEMRRDYAGARASYERVLKADPGFSLAATNLAFLLADVFPGRQTLPEADRLAQRALLSAPEDAYAQDTAGWVAYRRGDLRKAQTLLQKALAQQPEAPVINYHLGMVYLKESQRALAKRHLLKALGAGQPFMGQEEARKALEALG